MSANLHLLFTVDPSADLADIRTLAGWAVGILLFGLVVGIFMRTFRS